MSLHCLGARNVRTVANTVLNGADTLSVSFWVRLKPGSGVPASDALLLGKVGDAPFSAAIVGGTANRLRFRWSAGGASPVSSADLTLTPGIAYHVAATFSSGSQRYYLNGVLSKSDTAPGPVGGAAASAFQIGPGVDGLDVSIDDVAVWQGYALTLQDVNNLRDRISHPEAIANAQVAIRFTLAGGDDVAASPGAAGLADGSTHAMNATLVTNPAPVFESGVLTYSSLPQLHAAVVSGSGQTLAVATRDANGLPTNITAVTLGSVQKLTVTGVGGTFGLTLNGQTITVPYGVLPSNTDGTSGTGTLQALLETIVGVGKVTVVGYNPYKITFTTNQPALTVDTTNLLATRPADPLTAGTTPEAVHPVASRRGNWTVTSAGGGYSGSHFETPGPGDSTTEARWVVSGLAAGNYQVLGSWPGGNGFATNATFRVFDGSTYVGKMVVDQTTTSAGDATHFVTFEAIGTFHTATGTLNIVLTDDANGKVSADAIVVRPVDPSPTVRVLPLLTTGWAWSSYAYWNAAGGADAWQGTAYRASSSSGWWDIPFRGLRPGNYLVELNYHADPGNSAAAPVTVTIDGAANVVNVNQTSPPSGGTHNDGANNIGFTPLGSYSVVNGGGFRFRVTGAGGAFSSLSAFAVTRVSLAGISQAVSATVQAAGGPSYAINGGAAIPIGRTLWATNGTLPYAVLFLDTAVAPGDVVTFSAPAGVIATAAGALGAITGFPVTNRSGGSVLPAFNPAENKTLHLGWNVFTQSLVDVAMVYCDQMKQCTSFEPQPADPPTYNARGEVLSGTAYTHYFKSAFLNPINPRGYNSVPAGDWTVTWKGAGTPSLGFDAVAAGGATTVGDVKTQHYTVTKQANKDDVSLALTVTGPVTDLHIYPPGVPTDGSQVFHPEYLRMLQGSAALRSMVWINPNNNIINYSDIPTASDVSYQNQGFFAENFTIAQFQPYPNTENWVAPGYVPVLATVDRPHGFVSGSIGVFSGNYPAQIKIDVTGAPHANIVFEGYGIMIHYDPARMNPNQFVIAISGGGTFAGAVQPNPGKCIFYKRSGGPLDLYVDLCNQVGCDAWVNTTESMTDACVTAMFTHVANHLAPGRKCHVELMNEPWNYIFAFYHYYVQLGNSMGTGYMQAYASRAAHHHALARAAFQAAGRDPEQIVSVFNVFINSAALADGVAQYCQANGLRIDALAMATYYAVGPQDVPGFADVYNALTTEQVCDLAEYQNLFVETFAPRFAEHRAILDARGFPSAKLLAYEMGPATASLGGSDENQAKHTQGLHQHPRFRHILLDSYKELQDAGCVLGCLYVIHNVYVGEGSANGTKMYGAYTGWNQLAGKGDGSDGKADNRIDPWNTGAHVSVVGQSVLDWNAAPVALDPVAGTLALASATAGSVALDLATNTGGTPPYSNQLQRSNHGAGNWSNIGAPVPGATARLTDPTAAASGSYDYRVTVTDAAFGTGTANTVVVNVPAGVVPGTLTAGASATNVALTLLGTTGGTPPYSNQLQRSPSGAGTWSNLGAPVVGASPNFNDGTASNGTAYDYRVAVTDSQVPPQTVPSAVVTVTPGSAGVAANTSPIGSAVIQGVIL